MKRKYIILGILLICLISSAVFIKKINMKEEYETMEGEEVVISVIFSEQPESEYGRKITMFDSGRIEDIRSNSLIITTGQKEKFAEDDEIKTALLERESLEELISMAEELTNAQRKKGIDIQPRETSGGDMYMRVTYQEKVFEIWTMDVHSEIREYFDVEGKWTLYDEDVYATAKIFLEKIEGLTEE